MLYYFVPRPTNDLAYAGRVNRRKHSLERGGGVGGGWESERERERMG